MNAPATAPTHSEDSLWAALDAATAKDRVPELLEREARDIQAHLVWVGHDLKRARVAVGDRVVAGWMHSPDLEFGVIGFTPHQEVQSPEEGEPVRVVYGRGADGYIFESMVVAEDDGTWLMAIPTAIGSRGQRLTGRTPACGVWFLILDDNDQTEVEVHDLSTLGVGLLSGPDEPVRDVQAVLSGRLQRVDGFEVQVKAVVRHVSRLADTPDWLLTGCTLEFADAAQQAALAKVLAE